MSQVNTTFQIFSQIIILVILVGTQHDARMNYGVHSIVDLKRVRRLAEQLNVSFYEAFELIH